MAARKVSGFEPDPDSSKREIVSTQQVKLASPQSHREIDGCLSEGI